MTKTKSDTMLTTTDIATRLGVEESTIRSYHSRGQMPAPDGRVGRTPYWLESKLSPWLAERGPAPTGPVSPAASANTAQPCETCGAKPWHPCKSPKSGRTTDMHSARRAATIYAKSQAATS